MRRRQQGISLVEVLVALVSTSVGLLGIAALQLVSVRSNQEAYARLTATRVATSMIESLRANRAAIVYSGFDAVPFNGTGSATTPLESTLQVWQSEIDRSLPGGRSVAAGAIEWDHNVVVITVRWGVSGERPGEQLSNVRLLSVRTEI